MAEQSCQFMLWQQAVAGGKLLRAQRIAQAAAMDLAKIEKEFNAFWGKRNKGTTKHCSEFLQWRMADYGKMLSQQARKPRVKFSGRDWRNKSTHQ
jgi:hypothetical protein